MTEPETNPETGRQQRACLEQLAEWVAVLGEGNRNAGTYWAACRATEAGDDDALAAIANAAMSTGIDQRSVGKTVASVLRTGCPKAGSDREAAS